MMLRNRERVLMQLADLQKKLDAAEKVSTYRSVKAGAPIDALFGGGGGNGGGEFRRLHPSTRSFSRPAHGWRADGV